MRRQAWGSAALSSLLVLSLGACSEQAAQNPNAPGSPGSGNATEVVRPAMPDSPAGGPSPVAGASSEGVLPGTTGSAGAAGNNLPTQAGVGLNGGLASGSGLTGSFPAAAGSAGGKPGLHP